MIGKTIARIEENPIDPEFGGVDGGTLLVHFTDGTALMIEGHSYESVDLEVGELSAEDLATRASKIAEREAEKLAAERERTAWMALSCDERTARNTEKRKAMGPMALLMNEAYEGAYGDILTMANRQLYGGGGEPVVVRLRCGACGERACENAPTKTVEAAPKWSDITALRAIIPIGGSNAEG